MSTRVWVALVVVTCVGISRGEGVRAEASRTALSNPVSAGAAWPRQEKTVEGQESEGKNSEAKNGEVKAESGKTGAGHSATGRSSQGRSGRGKTESAQNAGGPLVDVNKASAEQLEALPGIGPSMASRIIEYRQKHGPFKKLEDLMNVRGIGEKNFLKLKPLITVGASKGESGTPQA